MSIKTYAKAINEGHVEMMTRDEKVFTYGEDIQKGLFGVTTGLVDQFGPMRVRNSPISEAALTGAGVGAAVIGSRPIVEIQFADVLAISFDHIVNSAAKIRYMSAGISSCPVVYRAPMGFGLTLGMHHSQCTESWFTNVPGLTIICPSQPYDAKGLFISAVESNDPVVFLEHKKLYATKGEVPDDYYKIPIGKGDIKREGKDITIIATSFEVNRAIEAAEMLSKERIEAEVVDPRTIKPLDKDLILSSVKKTGRVLIVHEAPKFGGFGGEIAAVIAEEALDYLQNPIVRLAGKEIPVPFAVEDDIPPSTGMIFEAAKGLFK